MASDRAGNFVAVWIGHLQENSMAVVLRRFDAGGHPLGPEIEVYRDQFFYGRPRIAVAPDGGMVVVWTHWYNGIQARRLAPDGQPAGAAFLAYEDYSCCDVLPDIAFLSSGDFVVVWHQEGSYIFGPIYQEPILGRVFDPAGVPRGDEFEVVAGYGRRFQSRVAADAAGGFAVAWVEDLIPFPLRVRRFNGDGSPRGSEIRVTNDHGFGPVPLFSPQGELSVAWINPGSTSFYDPSGIFAQRFAADGSLVGPKIPLADGSTLNAPLDATDDRQGHRLLVWTGPGATQESPSQIVVRSFDTAWRPTGPALPVAQFTLRRDVPGYGVHTFPPWPVIAAGTSSFLVVWDELGAPNARPSDTLLQVSARALAGSCLSDALSHCLAGARFRVGVSWHDPRGGATGAGNALPLTGDTGAFWFFSPGNAELLIKVLDGRPVNGHWWVFFGALSDVEYDVTVTDTWTGAQQVYYNPPYTLASRADVLAFAEAPAASAASAPVAQPSAADVVSHPGQSCAGGACIGPFEVTVDFTDPATGETHTAHGSPLGSDSSVFWFFSPDNIELIVKVLDGHAVNGHWWVFYGALSDVHYTIHVTWTDQNLTRSYHNPHGHMASRADTNAF